MAIKVNIVPKKNPTDQEAPPKYYAVVKNNGEATQRELSREISERSTVTPADSAAVLEALLAMIPRSLLNGNIVRLGDFGTFYITVSSKGSDTPESFKVSNIFKTKVRFVPGKEFNRIPKTAEFTKFAPAPQAPEEPETPES